MQHPFLVRWESQVKKGILEFIILLLLSKKELYGYELIVEMKNHTNYDIAEGTIYPLLNRLKADGLITSHWQEMESGIPRKYYTLNKEGVKVLGEMKLYWNELSTNIQQLLKK
jgi:PadR family transcriptional regulator PadR